MSGPVITDQILLILGAPRSGTTLLSAMVGAHRDIAILHEDTSLAMLHVLGKSYRGVKLCIPNHIRLSERSSILYRPLMSIRGIRRITRYMVESPYSIRDYQKLFPELRVLMILRAPDQVVSSIVRRVKWPKSYGKYCYEHALKTMWALAQDNANGHVKIVRFDSLVTEPEMVMRNVSSWLGFKYDAAMLEGFRFTPQYERDGIEPSKSSRGGYLKLLDQDPHIKAIYLELCRLAI